MQGCEKAIVPEIHVKKGNFVPRKKRSEPFEEALQKLEKIVERMEIGDMALEEALEAFAEGVRLVQFCHQKLEDAENKVQTLLEGRQGNWKTTPFETPVKEDSNSE